MNKWIQRNQKKTKLNSPTLAKHLKRLVERKLLEKRIDIKSGDYPYPVYYKVTRSFLPQLKIILMTEHGMHEIERILSVPIIVPASHLVEKLVGWLGKILV